MLPRAGLLGSGGGGEQGQAVSGLCAVLRPALGSEPHLPWPPAPACWARGQPPLDGGPMPASRGPHV